MKKIFSLAIVILLVGYNLKAQNSHPIKINNSHQEEFGFDQVHKQMMATDPTYR